MSDFDFAILGAGAIGASVAAWVAESYKSVWIMGRGEAQDALRKDGITTYDFAAPAETPDSARAANSSPAPWAARNNPHAPAPTTRATSMTPRRPR